MKHARPDYDRIQDPAKLIPELEPVFLLRAQDKASADTVRYWAQRAESVGADPVMVAAARAQAGSMAAWAMLKGNKVPDLPRDDSQPVKPAHMVALRLTETEVVDLKLLYESLKRAAGQAYDTNSGAHATDDAREAERALAVVEKVLEAFR